MRKFLIMSALILGMAALTATEVTAQYGETDGKESYYNPNNGTLTIWYSNGTAIVVPPPPGWKPQQGPPVWAWEMWENPLNP